MKVLWAILCQGVSMDKDTNNVSLFNVIEELQLAAQPPQDESEPKLEEEQGLVAVNFELVILWARTSEEIQERGYGRLRLILPDNKVVMAQENEVDLTHFLRLRARVRMAALPVRGQGTYLFKIDGRPTVSSEWTELFELPLRVVLQPQDSS